MTKLLIFATPSRSLECEMLSNLSVRSNLMLDDTQHEPKYKYLPGDFVVQVYIEFRDVRVVESYLSRQQLIEYRQYIKCIRCRRPCAGTCGG